MALPLRTRSIPQCTACIRSYVWSGWADAAPSMSQGTRQQVRGKKRMAKSPGTVPARLLKDLPGFGKKGAVIPISAGEMRNKWFPRRVAEYVTLPEMKTLRASNVPMERDYTFGREEALNVLEVEAGYNASSALAEPVPLPKRKVPEVAKLTPGRSRELLEIFVQPQLDFYRQPIVEEPEPEPEPEPAPEPNRERQRTASSAAADLLAARTQAPREVPKPAGPQGIYGSVSTHDLLVAVRASIAKNDEAARVTLNEGDIRFMDPDVEAEGRVKHVGHYAIEIKPRGGKAIQRTVRVVPQEV